MCGKKLFGIIIEYGYLGGGVFAVESFSATEKMLELAHPLMDEQEPGVASLFIGPG